MLKFRPPPPPLVVNFLPVASRAATCVFFARAAGEAAHKDFPVLRGQRRVLLGGGGGSASHRTGTATHECRGWSESRCDASSRTARRSCSSCLRLLDAYGRPRADPDHGAASWQPHRTAVRSCSVQRRHSAVHVSIYMEFPTLLTQGLLAAGKNVRHHSEGMLFPAFTHDNTRTRANGHHGSTHSSKFVRLS